MKIFENDEPCYKKHQRLEAEIELIISDYVWNIEPNKDSLYKLPGLIIELREQMNKEMELINETK